jgi:hypothetical protein
MFPSLIIEDQPNLRFVFECRFLPHAAAQRVIEVTGLIFDIANPSQVDISVQVIKSTLSVGRARKGDFCSTLLQRGEQEALGIKLILAFR